MILLIIPLKHGEKNKLLNTFMNRFVVLKKSLIPRTSDEMLPSFHRI